MPRRFFEVALRDEIRARSDVEGARAGGFERTVVETRYGGLTRLARAGGVLLRSNIMTAA